MSGIRLSNDQGNFLFDSCNYTVLMINESVMNQKVPDKADICSKEYLLYFLLLFGLRLLFTMKKYFYESLD